MSLRQQHCYEFGPFRLDAAEQQLLRDGQEIPIAGCVCSRRSCCLPHADQFDEKFTNIFAVQDSISQKVASALALKLSSEDRKGLSKRYTDNVEAYQLYLNACTTGGSSNRRIF